MATRVFVFGDIKVTVEAPADAALNIELQSFSRNRERFERMTRYCGGLAEALPIRPEHSWLKWERQGEQSDGVGILAGVTVFVPDDVSGANVAMSGMRALAEQQKLERLATSDA